MLYSVNPEYSEQFPALAQSDIASVPKDNPYKEEIAAWNSYATYLYQFAMSLSMALQIVDKTVKDRDTKAKIEKGLHALYKATQGVQEAFLQGVEDMKAGKKPEYHFDPVPVPPWPDPDNPKNFYQSIWNFARPILEQVIAKLPERSPLATAVVGMINSGDEIVKILNGVALPETIEG